jgi:hypothetical protein
MDKNDLSLNKASELCDKKKAENFAPRKELENISSHQNNDDIYFEKCPSHEQELTWEDKLGGYPDVKEGDVIDVYVFINGKPWQRK